MPIKSRRILPLTLMLSLGLGLHGDIKHSKSLPKKEKTRLEQYFVYTPPEFLSEFENSCISEPLRLDPDKKVISENLDLIMKSSLFERTLLKEKLFRHPRELYFIMDAYIAQKSTELGIDPKLSKTIFYLRNFDLVNPLGISDYNSVRNLSGYTLEQGNISEDPFLSIDIGLSVLQKIVAQQKKYDPVSVLTRYIYGQVKSSADYTTKYKLSKKALISCDKNYDSLIKRLGVRSPGKRFLKNIHMVLDLSKYKFLNMTEFISLSREQQIIEINKFATFVAKELNVPEEYILRLIKVESNYDYLIKNLNTNALGLMQIRPITFTDLTQQARMDLIFGRTIVFSELYNPYINIVLGITYYKYCYDILGSYDAANKAYNIGLEDFLRNYSTSRKLQKSSDRYSSKLSRN